MRTYDTVWWLLAWAIALLIICLGIEVHSAEDDVELHNHMVSWHHLKDPKHDAPCCDKECYTLPDDALEWTPDYVLIKPTNEKFETYRILQKSTDGKIWRCPFNNGLTRCIIVPPWM